MLTITPITKQYVTIDVAATLASGAPAVISGVDVALVQPRSAPTGNTAWTSAAYASGTATVLVAGYDADPTGALVIPAGWGADLWIRVVDSPEVTATKAMRLIVEPGADDLPAATSTTPYVQTIAGLSGIVPGPALMTALGSSLTAAIDAEITAHGGGGGAVSSVNTKTGAVVLSASDVGADASGAAAAAQAFAVQRANHTGTQSADTLTDGTSNKAFLATERTKLTGVATGATANSTDAQLRDRSTHTGTQPATTITGLATVATSGAYTDLTGKPAITTDVDYWSGRQHVGLATGSMFFGAMTTAQIAADITLIRAAGGDTVRTDLDWSAIETSHGVYDWTKPDIVFDTAAAQGVALIFTVVGSPAWARTAGEPSKIFAPTNVADYANFCAAASARYKDRGGKGGHLWEIWNEPNCSAIFGTPLDYAKYVALIGAAYTALKATDPSCTVIVGGILRGGRENWGTGTNLDTNWLQGAYNAGLAGKFDALGFHPYSEPWDPAALTPTGDPTGSNLISNGTFETNITGWAADNGTLAQSATQVHSGTKAMRLTASGAGVARAYFSNAPVVAGSYYLASAWIYAYAGDQIQASVNWSDSSFSYLSTDDGDALTVTATGWNFVTMRKDAAPAGATWAALKLQTINTPTAGTLYYYDDVALNVASSAEHGWNRIPDVRAVMAANGDAGKPIWITEVGQHTGSSANAVDEPTQALYLAHALQRLRSYPYVQRMMWYSHRDSGTDLTSQQANYGITHNDGSPKVAYSVMQSGADSDGVPSGGSSGQVLAKNSSTSYDTSWVTLGAAVQFTTPGAWATWTKPAGATMVHIFAVSAGGGGGGGASGATGTARGGGAGGAGGNLMRVSLAASVVPGTLFVNPGAGGAGGAAGATGSAGARSYVSIAQNTTAANLFAISGATDTAGGAGGTSSGAASGGVASGVPSTSLAAFLSLGVFTGTGGGGGAGGGNATGTAGSSTSPLNGVATGPGSGGGGTGTGNVDTAGGGVNAAGPLAAVAGGSAGGGSGNPGVVSMQPFCTSGGSGGGSSGASGTGGVGGAGAYGSGGGGGGGGVTGGVGGKGGDGIVIIVAI